PSDTHHGELHSFPTRRSSDLGTALINYFSKPCKPTKVNEGRTRNLPEHDLERWEQYKHYNIQDVVVEREMKRKMSKFNPSDFEKDRKSTRLNSSHVSISYAVL